MGYSQPRPKVPLRCHFGCFGSCPRAPAGTNMIRNMQRITQSKFTVHECNAGGDKPFYSPFYYSAVVTRVRRHEASRQGLACPVWGRPWRVFILHNVWIVLFSNSMYDIFHVDIAVTLATSAGVPVWVPSS